MSFKQFAVAVSFAICGLGAASQASANYNPLITIDEFGNGTLDFCGPGCPGPLPGVLAPDPGPGGLSSVLTYDLLGPPSLTAGDLLLFDAGTGVFSDVVRFNDYDTGGVPGYPASVVFYSNPMDGYDSAADIFSPPGSFYANTISLTEVNGRVFYHPDVGQPGYVPGFDVAYNILSDVPEPAAWALMLIGFGVLGAAARRQRQGLSPQS